MTRFFLNSPEYLKVGVSANTFASPDFQFDKYFDDLIAYSSNKFFQQGSRPEDILDSQISPEIKLKTLANGLLAKVDSEMTECILSKMLSIDITRHDGDAKRMSQTGYRLIMDSKEPIFMFINYMDAHAPFSYHEHLKRGPYDVPNDWHSDYIPSSARVTPEAFKHHKEDLEYYRKLYANNIDYLDRNISDFIRRLLKNTDNETTVIVTSDHGEDLGYSDDDYMLGHSNLSEAITHVPLIVINPPAQSCSEVPNYYTHLDIGDLILQVANNQPISKSLGRERVFSEVLRVGGIKRSDSEDIPHLDRAVGSIWENETRTVWDSLGNCEKYTINPQNPSKRQQTNTLNSLPEEEYQAFDCSIKQFNTVGIESIDVKDSTENRLRELGYL